MASVTLEQKKLEQLKQQLFGKSDSTYKITGKQLKDSLNTKRASGTTTLESINLKSDLLKITILSALALGIQFFLFFAQQNGFLRFF
jgi:hypothetical protein